MFSAVRAGSSHIGFVKDLQRLNVAITRAKHALVVVCDARAMESNDGWRSLIRSANARGLLCHVPVASHGPFKQQVDRFLSKSGPFVVDEAPTQRQQQNLKPMGTKDPRLQPTLQISSCAVSLPPSLQSVLPAPPVEKAPPAFRHVESPPTALASASHTVQGAAVVAPRPQKRAASPLTQPRPGEHRVAERAIAEQERQKNLQGIQASRQTGSPIPQQPHLAAQHQQLLRQREHTLPHHLPPVKRERLNEPAPQLEAAAAARGASVAFSPHSYNPQVSLLGSRNSPPTACPSVKPAPPVDASRSPRRELLLAVERLFAVPVLCAYVVWRERDACQQWRHLPSRTIHSFLTGLSSINAALGPRRRLLQ